MIIVAYIVTAAGGADVAAVAGFGIGSLLTPLLALDLGIKPAVALVALPHFAASVVRLWTLRQDVDRRLLLRFGLASAAAGLVGALALSFATSRALLILFGLLLVLTGLAGLTGWNRRLHLGGAWAVAAGAVSGLLGGMVGQQGGIRSAALLGFRLSPVSFVATATAVAVAVDVVRVPVYLGTQGSAVFAEWPLVVCLIGAALFGTLTGRRLLGHLPERLFARLVGGLLLVLGFYVIYQGAH